MPRRVYLWTMLGDEAVVERGLLAPAVGLALLFVAATASAQALSPEQAVHRAAASHPGLRAALADLAAARQAVRVQQAVRGPTLVARTSGEYAENLVETGQGVSRTGRRALGTDVALRYTTEIGTELTFGSSADVNWRSANLTPTTSSTVDLGPTPGVAARIEARQPLLRGAGRDVTLASLREARAGQSEAERTRDEAASALVRDVLVAYWELWYAERALAVQEAALEVAKAQLRDAHIRADQLGTAAETEVLRFASELASIEDGAAQARAVRQTRALELGRLLVIAPESAPSLAEDAEPPEPSAAAPLGSLVREARHESSELRALAEGVRAARERARAAADGDQARLDLTTTLSAGGLWADDALPGLSLPGDRPGWSTLVGLELELPLGDSATAAEHARALAQLDATEARHQARAQAIEAQAAQLHAQLEAARERVALSATMVEAATKLAAAERYRLQLGTATSTDVVQAQQSDREAELRHLRARVDQAQTALQLDHLVGALLVRHASPLGEVLR